MLRKEEHTEVASELVPLAVGCRGWQGCNSSRNAFFSSGAGSILIPVAFVSSCLKAFASSLPAGRPYRGKPSDMWALGVVLFTMLYGQFPFYDSIPQELFRKIKAAEYTIPE